MASARTIENELPVADPRAGHLEASLTLAFEQVAGRTVLSASKQEPPLRVVRAFPLDDGAALVHLHNVSGGLLGGDRIELDMRLAAGRERAGNDHRRNPPLPAARRGSGHVADQYHSCGRECAAGICTRPDYPLRALSLLPAHQHRACAWRRPLLVGDPGPGPRSLRRTFRLRKRGACDGSAVAQAPHSLRPRPIAAEEVRAGIAGEAWPLSLLGHFLSLPCRAWSPASGWMPSSDFVALPAS